jgi:hypothetical protein
MADEETKQLLRDILAAQKAQLEYLERQNRTYLEHSTAYEKALDLYRQHAPKPWEVAIRVTVALGILVLLAYLVFRG